MVIRLSPSGKIASADDIGFNPTVPANWSPVPDDVGEALDQLAARDGALTTLSSGVSANTAALGFADVYRMTANPTTLTISSVDITEGRVFIIRAVVASVGNPVTIATEGAETIDGAVSVVLTTAFDSITLQTTGGNLESIA